MIFNRKYRYSSALPAEDIKSRLVGSHLQVHHLDFEVLEKENMLRIIPHAEEVNSVKTLPITHVEFGSGNKGTQVVISAKPLACITRRIREAISRSGSTGAARSSILGSIVGILS